MIGVGLLLILSPLLFILNNPEAAPAPAPTVALQGAIPLPNIERVALDDAYAAWQSGEAVIVDVRGKQFYDMGHIPGAFSLPEDELPARLNELNPQDWIITYCT